MYAYFLGVVRVGRKRDRRDTGGNQRGQHGGMVETSRVTEIMSATIKIKDSKT